MTEFNWKSVPKAALVDTLRNHSQGPSNLSGQDKGDLVNIAERYLRAKPDYTEKFFDDLQTEITYQKNKATARREKTVQNR